MHTFLGQLRKNVHNYQQFPTRSSSYQRKWFSYRGHHTFLAQYWCGIIWRLHKNKLFNLFRHSKVAKLRRRLTGTKSYHFLRVGVEFLKADSEMPIWQRKSSCRPRYEKTWPSTCLEHVERNWSLNHEKNTLSGFKSSLQLRKPLIYKLNDSNLFMAPSRQTYTKTIINHNDDGAYVHTYMLMFQKRIYRL